MQTMAQQVLVYRLTGSAAALGIVSFMVVLPLVPFALWGGSLSDRVPKRAVLLTTQILMMCQAFVLAALTWTGVVKIWHIYLMAFLLGTFRAVDMPARHSFVVEMVEGKEDLTSAIGLNSAIQNGAKMLGPALAGVMVAMLGEAVAFFLNSLSFLAVIASLLLMRDTYPASVDKQEHTHMVPHVVEGLRFLFGQQILLILMSLVAVNSFLSRPYQVLMPVFADVKLGGSAQPIIQFLCNGRHLIPNCRAPAALPLGFLLTAVGIGAVTGALLVASLSQHAQRGRLLTLGNLSLPLLLLIFVNSGSMAFSLVVLVLVGLSQVLQNAMANTLLQVSAPDLLRGRVMSLYSLVAQGMTQVGNVQAGFVADWIGAPMSVGIGATISLIYGSVIALRYRQVRQIT
jgi:MFS family permease